MPPLDRQAERGRWACERSWAPRYNIAKQAFLEHPGVLGASALRFLPGWGGGFVRIVKPEGHDGAEWRMLVKEADEDFLQTLGVPLLAGRTFSPAVERDRGFAYILNEAAVKSLGWTVEDTVGRRFGHPRLSGNGLEGSCKPRPAVHLLLSRRGDRFRLPVRKKIRENRRRLFGVGRIPDVPGTIQADFVRDEAAPTREIGIRKALGRHAYRDSGPPDCGDGQAVSLANLLAWPVAYYAAKRWLQDFAYRISPGIGRFALSALAVFGVALLAVGSQAVRAARENPAAALRHE